MSDPKQLNLDGKEVGAPFTVKISETFKTEEHNARNAQRCQRTETEHRTYTLRSEDWRTAAAEAMERHIDIADGSVKVIRVTEG